MDNPPIRAEDHSFHIEQLVEQVGKHERRLGVLETRASDMESLKTGVELLVHVFDEETISDFKTAIKVLNTTRGVGRALMWISLVLSGIALTIGELWSVFHRTH
ncbi:MAG: hypothetical protein ACYDBH_00455 [Acidobacteriaceae bacterium]